jgi:hypothetical protein
MAEPQYTNLGRGNEQLEKWSNKGWYASKDGGNVKGKRVHGAAIGLVREHLPILL